MKQHLLISKALKSLLFFFTLSFAFNAKAGHMTGCDISYKCISQGKYQLIAKIYRDCRGLPFNSPTATLSAKGCTTQSITLSRTGIKDISQVCSSTAKPCSPSNTTIGVEGIEEHTYELTVDFNVAPYNAFKNNKCCEVFFGVGLCCRNSVITTGSANQDLWADAMINICMPKMNKKTNSSPILTTPPLAYLCCNQGVYYNYGAIDTIEYDSFSYELTSGYDGSGKSSISYNSPLSKTLPMTSYCPGSPPCTPNPSAIPTVGFFFEKSIGDMAFVPTNCSQVGVIVVQINEYRRDSLGAWQLIGQTRRDMQTNVRNCSANNSPVITGTQTSTVCEGGKICFTIKATDKQFIPNQLKADTVTLTWNNGIPKGTFTIKDPKAREKEAEFCWQTKMGDARETFYNFTATAQDNVCDLRNVTSKGFRVKVGKRAKTKTSFTVNKCYLLVFESKPDSAFVGTPVYKWELKDSTNTGYIYKKSAKQKDTFQFTHPGKYYLTHTISNKDNCASTYIDSVVVPTLMNCHIGNGRDTAVCFGTTLKLTSSITKGLPPYHYAWSTSAGHKPADTLTTFETKVTANTYVILKVTDDYNCPATDTIQVVANPLPVFNYSSLSPYCYNDGNINLHLETNIFPDKTRFYGKDPASVTCSGSPGMCVYNTSRLQNNKLGLNGKSDTIYFDFTDSNGCYNKDSLVVQVYSNPIVQLRDRIYCKEASAMEMDSSIILPKIKSSFIYNWSGDRKPVGANWTSILSNKGTKYVPDWEFDVPSAPTGQYVVDFLIANITTGCSTLDSCKINIPEPKPNLGNDTSLINCKSTVLNPGKFKSYLWSNATQNASLLINKSNLSVGKNILFVDVKDSNNCKGVDSVKVILDKPFGPRPNLGSDKTLAHSDSLVMNPGKFASYSWNIGGGNQTKKVDKSNLVVGKNEIIVQVIDSVGCDDADTINITLLTPLGINKSPLDLGWKIYPVPAQDVLNIESPNEIPFQFKLFDLNGKIITFGNGEGKIKLATQNLSPGTYIISLTSNGQTLRQKVLK